MLEHSLRSNQFYFQLKVHRIPADKLIGVHCTHGLNRTGLMICAHMIQKCNIDPNDAVASEYLCKHNFD